MDKRQRHNLLLILALTILVIGAAVQVYLMVTAEQTQETQPTEQSTSPPE